MSEKLLWCVVVRKKREGVNREKVTEKTTLESSLAIFCKTTCDNYSTRSQKQRRKNRGIVG